VEPLDALSYATFRDRVGEVFTVSTSGVALALEAVEDMGAGAGVRANGAFSLVFRGPSEPLLPQGIHELEHDELATCGLFLVPLSRDDSGCRYEAAFN
jgi:hypothetical protein